MKIYEISYHGIEQFISPILPAWRLFTVRITWFYSTPLLFMRAVGLVVWLASHGECPAFDTHIIPCSIGYFFIANSVLYFLLSLSQNG